MSNFCHILEKLKDEKKRKEQIDELMRRVDSRAAARVTINLPSRRLRRPLKVDKANSKTDLPL